MDDLENVLYNYCDLIMEVRTNLRSYPTWVRESNRFADKLWHQIEERIDKNGNIEAIVAMTFLINCLGKTIRKSLPKENIDKIAEQIRDHLIKEIKNFK